MCKICIFLFSSRLDEILNKEDDEEKINLLRQYAKEKQIHFDDCDVLERTRDEAISSLSSALKTSELKKKRFAWIILMEG